MTPVDAAVAAVEELAERTKRAEALLAQVVAGVVASSPTDGLTTVRIPGPAMDEIRRRAAS